MSGRYHGDEARKDIHESNLAYLERSRMAADYCARKLNWQTIECAQGDEVRSIQDIQEEIQQLIQGKL